MRYLFNIFFFFSFLFGFLLVLIFHFFAGVIKPIIPKQRPLKKILYIENFPIENAGFQNRAKKWAEILESEGFFVSVSTIIPEKEKFDKILENDDLITFFIKSLQKRFLQCLHARKFETVIVRRELLLFNDYGNLFMEKFLLKIHTNVILDFDDDIAASKRQPKTITSLYGKLMLEDGNKFNNSLRLYKRFIVASNYLKEKVKNENRNVRDEDILVIPTCVDYNQYKPKEYAGQDQEICLGWIGGDHNYNLLAGILPDLEKIASETKIKLLVVGGSIFEHKSNLNVQFIPWSMDTEVESLLKIDVGLMPLIDDAVNRGKGGFKLIQYMGLGIVSMATGLTINNEIVDDGENGFLVPPGADWYPYLKKTILARADFARIGTNARQRIMESYTFTSNAKKYIDFLKRS